VFVASGLLGRDSDGIEVKAITPGASPRMVLIVVHREDFDPVAPGQIFQPLAKRVARFEVSVARIGKIDSEDLLGVLAKPRLQSLAGQYLASASLTPDMPVMA